MAEKSNYKIWVRLCRGRTQSEAMVDGEEGTPKYAQGAKRETKLQSSAFAYFAHFVVKRDFRDI
jgi:hypothetical protein